MILCITQGELYETNRIYYISIVLIVALIGVGIIFSGSQSEKIRQHLNVGAKYMQDGNYTEAILAFEKVLEFDENNIDALLGLAEAHHKNDEVTRAISILKVAIEEVEDPRLLELLNSYMTAEDMEDIEVDIDTVETDTEGEVDYEGEGRLMPPTPVASMPSGTYDSPIEITFTEAEGYQIYFTTDEWNSTMDGEYGTYIDSSVTLLVYSEDDAGNQSDMAIYEYVIETQGFHVYDLISDFSVSEPDKVVEFVDPIFEQKVKEELQRIGTVNETILWKDLEQVYGLFLDVWDEGERITSLEDLKWLINLRSISISGNVEGELSDFAQLKNLTEIHMDTGAMKNNTILEGNISDISELEYISVLGLDGSNLTGDLETFGEFQYLESLWLHHTSVVGDLASLNGSEYLKYLWVGEDYYDDNGRLVQTGGITGNIASLVDLSNLEILSISGAEVTGELQNLASLTRLVDVNFHWTQVQGNIGDLAGLEKLESIDLTDEYNSTRIIGDISSIGGLSSLRRLNLHDVAVSGDISGLVGLTNLQELSLWYTDVTGDIGVLSKSTALERLVTNGTDVTGSVELANGEIYEAQ